MNAKHAQNSGNPVLDSLVNISMACASQGEPQLRKLHAVLLDLAEKEPGGMKRPSGLVQNQTRGRKRGQD